jgi:diphthine-ammonia ligase
MFACLFSGGKDSTLALHKAWNAGKKADLLITMVPENEYSYMFHKVDIGFTGLQAEALGIRHVMAQTAGEKENELRDLERVFKEQGVTELVTGAVASVYQRDRVNSICKRLGIDHIAPLWGINPVDELREIAKDYKVIITQVTAEGLDESYLGAEMDDPMVERIIALNKRYGIHMAFEGGEAETFVLDAPMFRKRIKVVRAHKVWDGKTGQYVIEEAALSNKGV